MQKVNPLLSAHQNCGGGSKKNRTRLYFNRNFTFRPSIICMVFCRCKVSLGPRRASHATFIHWGRLVLPVQSVDIGSFKLKTTIFTRKSFMRLECILHEERDASLAGVDSSVFQTVFCETPESTIGPFLSDASIWYLKTRIKHFCNKL